MDKPKLEKKKGTIMIHGNSNIVSILKSLSSCPAVISSIWFFGMKIMLVNFDNIQ